MHSESTAEKVVVVDVTKFDAEIFNKFFDPEETPQHIERMDELTTQLLFYPKRMDPLEQQSVLNAINEYNTIFQKISDSSVVTLSEEQKNKFEIISLKREGFIMPKFMTEEEELKLAQDLSHFEDTSDIDSETSTSPHDVTLSLYHAHETSPTDTPVEEPLLEEKEPFSWNLNLSPESYDLSLSSLSTDSIDLPTPTNLCSIFDYESPPQTPDFPDDNNSPLGLLTDRKEISPTNVERDLANKAGTSDRSSKVKQPHGYTQQFDESCLRLSFYDGSVLLEDVNSDKKSQQSDLEVPVPDGTDTRDTTFNQHKIQSSELSINDKPEMTPHVVNIGHNEDFSMKRPTITREKLNEVLKGYKTTSWFYTFFLRCFGFSDRRSGTIVVLFSLLENEKNQNKTHFTQVDIEDKINAIDNDDRHARHRLGLFSGHANEKANGSDTDRVLVALRDAFQPK